MVLPDRTRTCLEEFVREGVESLSQWSVMSVRSLAAHSTSFTCRMTCQPNKTKVCPTPQGKFIEEKYTKLQSERCVLQGKLLPHHLIKARGQRSKVQTGDPWNVYLTDDSGAVACQLSEEVSRQNVIGKEVIASDWNYIRNNRGGTSFVEVEKVVLLDGECEYPRCDVISVTSTLALMNNRDQVAVDTVSIMGSVRYVSEPVRVKGDALFLVQVEDHNQQTLVNILVKKVHCLHWYSLIHPQRTYVFTNLRPTTLYKGTPQQESLLVPWNQAAVYPAQSVHTDTMTLQSWIVKYSPGSDVDIESLQDDVKNLQKPPAKKSALFSYQGVITDDAQAAQGIYELDYKVRLYVTFIPAVHRYLHLRPGTKVTVYNAHHKGAAQVPKIRLSCCTVGCVKIQTFSPLDTKPAEFDGSLCMATHLSSQYSLNILQLEWLFAVQDSLQEKLSPQISSKACGKMLYGMLTDKSDRHGHSGWNSKPRNFLLEFLDAAHTSCTIPPAQAQQQVPYNIPTIKQISEWCQKEAADFTQAKRHLVDRKIPVQQINDALYWSHSIVDKTWIIIGWLQLNGSTGRLQLVDNSGAVDCITAHSPDISSLHQCAVPDDSAPCPYLHSHHHGALVRLGGSTQVVFERFVCSNFLSHQDVGDKQYLNSVTVRTYLQFSMQDVTFLTKKNKSKKNESETFHEICGVKRTAEDAGYSGDDGAKRLKMTSSENKKQEKDYQRMSVDKIESGTLTHSMCQLFVLAQKDALQIKNQSKSGARLSFYALVYFIGNPFIPETVDNTESDSFCLPDSLKMLKETATQNLSYQDTLQNHGQLVALSFQDGCVRWYSLLSPGCVYALVKSSCTDGAVFCSRLSHEGLKKAIEKTKCRLCMGVTRDMELHSLMYHTAAGINTSTRVAESLHKIAESLPMKTIISSLSQAGHIQETLSVRETKMQSEGSLVTFEGVVRSRTFRKIPGDQLGSTGNIQRQEQKNKLRVSVPGDREMRVVVRDVDTPDEIVIHMDLRKLSYPLGLLPGALARFSRLQMGRQQRCEMHCRYIVTSGICILRQAPSHASTNRKDGETDVDTVNLDQSPLMFLSDVVLTQHASLFRCSCELVRIIHISLRVICQDCGAIWCQRRCTEASCSSELPPGLEAKLTLLVDDGTSNAVVYGDREDLITLLSLTKQQWAAFGKLCQKQGEVLYSQNDRFENLCPAGQVLFLLCQSGALNQQIEVLCRPFQNSYKGQTSNMGNTAGGCELKGVNIGGHTIHTFNLPLMQLYCVRMKKPSAQQRAAALI